MSNLMFAIVTPKLLKVMQDAETGSIIQLTNTVGQYRMVWRALTQEEAREVCDEMYGFARDIEESATRLSDFASAFYAATEAAQQEAMYNPNGLDENDMIEFLRENIADPGDERG